MADQLPLSRWSPQAAAHLLARAGFGGRPEEIVELYGRGLVGAVDWLLSDEGRLEPEAPWDDEAGSLHQELRQTAMVPKDEQAKLRQAVLRKSRQQTGAARSAWMAAMTGSRNPLGEKLALFWHDHFATSVVKVRDPQRLWRQIEIFRRLGQGNFVELVQTVSRDAAMIQWLDTQLSRKEGPNENFARELLELFVLGEGNYSEDDIAEVARAFTGYRFDPATGAFWVNEFQVDGGIKKFLGVAGRYSGDEMIELACDTDASREFLAAKLWDYFAGSGEAVRPISRMARELKMRDGRIDAALRTLFLGEDFYSPAVVGTQVKCPVQWLVHSCRVLEVDLPPQPIQDGLMTQLGQLLYQPPNVGGWNWGRAWINGGTLSTRHQASTWLVGMRDEKAILPALRKGGPTPEFERLVEGPMEGIAANAVLRLFGPGEHPRLLALAESELSGGGRRSRRSIATVFQKLMHAPEYQLT